jgi:transcriptional regulator with XRE-family HTH domain
MTDFPQNLRFLCGYRPSISIVGRDLKINRSQLNRYLSGASAPRPALMQRICDYFGVEQHEILLPHEEFAQILRPRALPGGGLSGDGVSRMLREHFDRIMQHSDPRARQLSGTFFEYYYSMAMPGQVLRALVAFEAEGEHMFYRRLERMGPHDRAGRRHYRYQGMTLMTGDRIFMNDYEYSAGIEITQTVLFPDYSFRWTALHGVKIGVSANREHVPCCVRVYMERTPPRTRTITNLRRCGLFAADSPEIPDYVLPLISNRESREHAFTAHGDNRLA